MGDTPRADGRSVTLRPGQGADSLRQHMGHPTSAPQTDILDTSALLDDTNGAGALAPACRRFHSANGVYSNDKHKRGCERLTVGSHEA